ncbi:hypothetical protein ADL00_28990 [Streptomyces sp. AS58]|nr:hypothetical protein ADL00_28990 [Streptomyces sp. AS58]
MAVDPLIELRDVNKYYGEPRVPRDTGRTVGRGEVVVAVGPSGSGKSTPRRVIKRPAPVRSGTVPLGGRPLTEEGGTLARLRAH